MPELEDSIRSWRKGMLTAGIKSPVPLDELESHLREDIEAQLGEGVGEQEAIATSMARLGQTHLLREEFEKIPNPNRERIRTAVFTLAGIPAPLQATEINCMEGNRNYEPRWATYTKAAVFLTPAISLWTFSVLFLLPKLKHICREAGVALPSVYQTTGFIADNMVPMTGAVMLLLGLLEWRWSRWPEFRRISLSSAVFLLNGAILALITLMVLFALLAAPALMQHAK